MTRSNAGLIKMKGEGDETMQGSRMDNIKAILVIVAGVGTVITLQPWRQTASASAIEYIKHDVVRDTGGKPVIGNNEKIRPQ